MTKFKSYAINGNADKPLSRTSKTSNLLRFWIPSLMHPHQSLERQNIIYAWEKKMKYLWFIYYKKKKKKICKDFLHMKGNQKGPFQLWTVFAEAAWL